MVAVNTLKRFISVIAVGLGLLALAVFMVLTNTVTLLITLAVLAAVIVGSSRLILAGSEETHRKSGTG